MAIALIKTAENLGEKLKKKGWKLVTAESCTGGGVAYYITSIPGSSDWFDRSFVTYSNNAKIQMLNVNPNTLEHFGAVSEETAREMAEKSLHHSQAQVSIAITGIAGPTGETPEKPIGTVWIAFSGTHLKTHSQCFQFLGTRIEIREQAIFTALQKLIELMSFN